MNNRDDVERESLKLDDREAIMQLKALYCDVCDDGHNPDRLGEVFLADAIWESSAFGLSEGLPAIQQTFRSLADRISFSQHMVTNPIIEIDGDLAFGRWNYLAPMTLDGRDVWRLGRYDDVYRKADKIWRIQRSKVIARCSGQASWGPIRP